VPDIFDSKKEHGNTFYSHTKSKAGIFLTVDIAGFQLKVLEARLKPRSEISEFLRDEIVSRYYYQKGAIRATLGTDPNVQKAREVLNQGNIFAGYFRPGTVISAN
jgi:hypothetical protein